MDLSKSFPRSPYDMNAGLVMLPRTTDKARAQLAGTLGEYIYACALDDRLFEFLGIDADRFSRQLEQRATDEEIAAWIDQDIPRSQLEKDAFNNKMRHLKPEGEEGETRFKEKQEALGRDDFSTFFDHLDADEGRF